MLKIETGSKILLKKLGLVEGMTDRKNSAHTCMRNVCIESDGSRVKLKASNFTSCAEVEFGSGTAGENGKAIVNCERLKSALKSCGNSGISITEEGGKLVIESEKAKSEIPIETDDRNFRGSLMPLTPAGFAFDRVKLLGILEAAEKSASAEPEQAAVNCVRFEIRDGSLHAVATDTYRLTYVREYLKDVEAEPEDGLGDGSGEELAISVPLAVIRALIKAMKSMKSRQVFLDAEGSKASFSLVDLSSGKFESIARLSTELAGYQFPDYQSILKNSATDKKVLVNTRDFTEALKNINAVSRSSKSAKNHVIANIKGGSMRLAGDSGGTEIAEELPVIQEGRDILISLNAKFLLDFLPAVKEKLTEIHLSEPNRAVKVKGENRETPVLFAMPLAYGTQYK